MIKTTSKAFGAAVLVVALVGCGGGDEEQAREAISGALRENANDTFQIDEEEADCVAEGMVQEIGVDQLIDYGLLTEDLGTSEETLGDLKLEQQDADATAEAFVDCVDVEQVLVESISEGFGGQLTEEMESCMEEKLTEQVVKEFLASVFAGDQAGATKLVTDELSGCAPS